MEIYDELASCSSDGDDNDPLYDPSPVRKPACHGGPLREWTLQKSGLDKENREPNLAASFSGLLRDGDDVKKISVEQCKHYLRFHRLRLTGTKAVLIERIKGHVKEQENDGIVRHCEPTLNNNNHGVLRNSIDHVQEELIKSFASMDVNDVSSSNITKLLEDEKKLTIQDCKAYLRTHGLRLAGTKQVLIERIREHLRIQDDNGMNKYPEESFCINCQGDACIGDVVLFKQKVYEFFRGPVIGVRTIAGRIIKESYGSAKQQHTFTVEVLWSIGDRALLPLHPLIIKGRNLYRVKTLRQAWADEGARNRQLDEKHARGAAARMERKARIEGKNANWHFKKQKREKIQAINSDGGNLVSGKRKENILMKDQLPNLQRKIGAIGKMASNLERDIDAIGKMTSNNQAKTDSSWTSSAPMHAKHSSQSVSIYAANSDASFKRIASVHAAKVVDPSCKSGASVQAAKFEYPCNYFASTHARNVDMVSSISISDYSHLVYSTEVKFNNSLAGLIVGTHGTYQHEIVRVSGARVCVERDPMNPALCIVRVTGTVKQKDMALKMVYQKICCKFFANNGECRYGEACRFLHALVE